ncbi:MAG TPA: hypothetical protein VFN51_03030 [Candidatus Saccharimonadales bacterium]|nr:hypothetical protein [Candidatus Saccharimonadales bacterium]
MCYFYFVNVGESHEFLNEFSQDLAAEPDPHIRSWYEEEFKLQPEYAESTRTQEQIGVLARQLIQLAEQKADVSDEADSKDENLIEPNVPEQPIILTPEQQLRRKVRIKYAKDYEQYQVDLGKITTKKRSKREHQEHLAKRQFARQFTDFSDVTGDKHVVLRADLLDFITSRLCDDAELADEIFLSSANYAEKHGGAVTANPNNFAAIIEGSVQGQPSAPNFEAILKSIFSTRYNIPNFGAIHNNLARASFELLDNQPALSKIVRIASLVEPYMSSTYIYAVMKEVDSSFYGNNDLQAAVDAAQTKTIFDNLNQYITGIGFESTQKEKDAITRLHQERHGSSRIYGPTHKLLLDLAEKSERGLMAFDPVIISHIEGDQLEFGQIQMPDELEALSLKSELFHKRMQHFAPYAYSVMAAMQIIESAAGADSRHLKGGVDGLSLPLSPTLAVDIYFPTKQWPTPKNEAEEMQERAGGLTAEILGVALMANELGISSFEKTGRMHLVYKPLGEKVYVDGITIYRPCIATDIKTHTPLQLLLINYARHISRDNSTPSSSFDTAEAISKDMDEANNHLRQTIREEQKRFLGRRSLKFVMPKNLKETGLESVNLRYDPTQNRIISSFYLDDGIVELKLDRDFYITDSGPMSFGIPTMKGYYENLILKLVKEWSCANEIDTSEGLINDENGKSANMGHYAYLRIRETDGKKFVFSEEQARYCLEEQMRDLAKESERLKTLDPTGKQRNSTYVRENYDPSKPPLEIYYSKIELD